MSFEQQTGVRNRLVAATMAASLMISACTGRSGHHESTASLIPPEQITLPAAPQSCIEPTASDISAVQYLLAVPENPALNHTYDGQTDVNKLLASDQAFKEAEAKKLGLTIFSGRELTDTLFADLKNKSASFETFMTAATGFMNQLGVTVEVGDNLEHYAYGGRALTPQELESDNAKLTLIDIIEAFDDVPVQYVQLAGLKRIVLMTGTDTQDVQGYADTSGLHDTFYADISKTSGNVLDPHGILHETTHLLDANQCGADDMMVDGTFSTLTPQPSFYSGKTVDQRYASFEETFVPKYLLGSGPNSFIDRIQVAEQIGDVKTYCSLLKQEGTAAAQVLSYTDYHPNPAEDKAEIGAEIADPEGYINLADPSYTILYSKFRFLLARLYHQSPNIVKYFATISQKPVPDPLQNQCPKP